LAANDLRTVAYVEIDRFSQEIIRARVRDGLLEDAVLTVCA
jgi:hypothetical protein